MSFQSLKKIVEETNDPMGIYPSGCTELVRSLISKAREFGQTQDKGALWLDKNRGVVLWVSLSPDSSDADTTPDGIKNTFMSIPGVTDVLLQSAGGPPQEGSWSRIDY